MLHSRSFTPAVDTHRRSTHERINNRRTIAPADSQPRSEVIVVHSIRPSLPHFLISSFLSTPPLETALGSGDRKFAHTAINGSRVAISPPSLPSPGQCGSEPLVTAISGRFPWVSAGSRSVLPLQWWHALSCIVSTTLVLTSDPPEIKVS